MNDYPIDVHTYPIWNMDLHKGLTIAIGVVMLIIYTIYARQMTRAKKLQRAMATGTKVDISAGELDQARTRATVITGLMMLPTLVMISVATSYAATCRPQVVDTATLSHQIASVYGPVVTLDDHDRFLVDDGKSILALDLHDNHFTARIAGRTVDDPIRDARLDTFVSNDGNLRLRLVDAHGHELTHYDKLKDRP